MFGNIAKQKIPVMKKNSFILFQFSGKNIRRRKANIQLFKPSKQTVKEHIITINHKNIMKQLFFSACLSGAMLVSVISYGQHTYIYKQKTASAVNAKRVYSNSTRVNAISSENRPSLLVTDPPIINDPIDIYAENPTLLKATLIIHFGNINISNTSGTASKDPHLYLYASPYYLYHNANHIIISALVHSTFFHSNTAYAIPMYANSDNHWTVTYNDFVTKWADASHSHLDFNYYKSEQGGSFSLYQLGMSGSISKLILVLQFASGTKTIVWNDPKTFDTQIQFKFDQNFNPMN